MTIRKAIARRIIAHVQKREPDFIIGGKDNPYLRRWWLLPRNRFFNAYVHQFLRSDDDRALHGHPWLFNLSWLMDGSYFEWVPAWRLERGKDDQGEFVEDPLRPVPEWRFEGRFHFRWGAAPHRVQLLEMHAPGQDLTERGQEMPVWTLFITGPKVREWGFYCPKGWIHWTKFCDSTDKGNVGKGCAD